MSGLVNLNGENKECRSLLFPPPSIIYPFWGRIPWRLGGDILCTHPHHRTVRRSIRSRSPKITYFAPPVPVHWLVWFSFHAQVMWRTVPMSMICYIW